MTPQYSTAQKLCLAGMVVGSILAAVGGCAPYWLVFDPEGFGLIGDIVSSVVSADMGVFLYCLEVDAVLVSESQCKLIGFDFLTSDMTWLLGVRIATAACILVGGFCGLCALCLACCSCCRRFVALGIMAILAAAAGVFSAVVFSQKTDIFTTNVLGFQITSFGWAFYVFCAGVGVLGLSSFVACFASPENHNAVHSGMVLSQPPPQALPATTQLAVIAAPSAPAYHPNAVVP